MRGADAGTGKISITTQALNRWSSGNKYVWNNKDLSPFTVSAVMSAAGGTNSFSTGLSNGGLGAAHGAVALNQTNCNFHGSQRIVFGQFSLSINDVYAGKSTVTGSTSGGTTTVSEYVYQNNTLGSMLQSKQASGSYQATMDTPISPNSRVYAKSLSGDLEAHTYTDSILSCFLYDVPETLDFGVVAVSGHARWVNRVDTNWTISVMDMRDTGGWELYASATAFTAPGCSELDGGLMFVSGSASNSLLGSNVLIQTNPTGPHDDIVDVNWPAEEGLRMYLEPFAGEPGAAYSATISWTLSVGP